MAYPPLPHPSALSRCEEEEEEKRISFHSIILQYIDSYESKHISFYDDIDLLNFGQRRHEEDGKRRAKIG